VSSTLTDILVGGVSRGAMYALVALGYTMVYGVLGMINFAHGEIFMIGMFSCVFAMGVFSLAWGT
jgi:branched-chain amino acid transport system permease protein